MIPANQSFLTDAKGKKIGVFLTIKEYEKLLEELEDYKDIKLFDEGKKDTEPTIPIDEAFKRIDQLRKK